MKEFLLEMDGEFIRVKAQKINGTLWYHVNGKTQTYNPNQETRETDQETILYNFNEITAPMPGKIIKLLKKEGDLVNPEDTVVVMEAMKMEYNLKVHCPAVIKKILCQENETVKLGQKLVKIDGEF